MHSTALERVRAEFSNSNIPINHLWVFSPQDGNVRHFCNNTSKCIIICTPSFYVRWNAAIFRSFRVPLLEYLINFYRNSLGWGLVGILIIYTHFAGNKTFIRNSTTSDYIVVNFRRYCGCYRVVIEFVFRRLESIIGKWVRPYKRAQKGKKLKQ